MSSIAPIWITARAAGIGALAAASLSACLGLTAAIRPDWTRGRRIELAAAHEALSLATIALILLHGVALLLDPVLKANVFELIVPGASPYATFASALGQIAAIGMIGLGLSYYARSSIGTQRWRKAHRFVSLFWLLGVAHGVLIGTDASRPWFLAVLALPVVTAFVLLAGRYADWAMREPV